MSLLRACLPFLLLEEIVGVDNSVLVATALIVPNLAAAVGYVLLVSRAAAGIRYARR